MTNCTHRSTIVTVTPSARGCEEWPQDRQVLGCTYGCAANAAMSGACASVPPHRHATAHFHATAHPIIEGYDPPEGWGWCYVDEEEIDLPDQTPQRGPIPRFV